MNTSSMSHPPLTRAAANRVSRLLPGGQPRYVRVYDNGGTTADRFTVVFTGRAPVMRCAGMASQHPYLAMSANPFHPQGFGQHGHTNDQPADTIGHDRNRFYIRPPAIGRKNHLGRRAAFRDLPVDCQRLTLRDYREIWALPE